MRRKAKAWGAVVLLAFVVASASCKGGMVRADAIYDSVGDICDRHDAYVQSDAVATPEQKARWLRTTELLRAVVAEALKR